MRFDFFQTSPSTASEIAGAMKDGAVDQSRVPLLFANDLSTILKPVVANDLSSILKTEQQAASPPGMQ